MLRTVVELGLVWFTVAAVVALAVGALIQRAESQGSHLG